MRKLIFSAIILSLIFVGVSAGCVSQSQEEKVVALESIRAKLISVKTQVTPDKQVDVISTLELVNPNDFDVKLIAVMHKLMPEPFPGASLWPPTYEYYNINVPAKGSMTVTTTTTIPKTGAGAQYWDDLISPNTKWSVIGQVTFAREAMALSFTGIK